MAITSIVVAAGTKLYCDDGAGGSYAQVARVVTLNPPNMTAAEIDVTELDPYDGTTTLPTNPEFWQRFIAGWRNAGEAGFTLNMTQSNWQQMQVFYRRGTTVGWKIFLRNGTILPFSGFLKGLQMTAEKEGVITAVASIKLDGSVEFTTTT